MIDTIVLHSKSACCKNVFTLTKRAHKRAGFTALYRGNGYIAEWWGRCSDGIETTESAIATRGTKVPCAAEMDDVL